MIDSIWFLNADSESVIRFIVQALVFFCKRPFHITRFFSFFSLSIIQKCQCQALRLCL